MMPLVAILVLAAGTFAFRMIGPSFSARLRLSPALHELLSAASIILLVGLVAISALTQGQEFAGWARPVGVLVGAILAFRKVPFPIVVIAAAGTAAALRWMGIS